MKTSRIAIACIAAAVLLPAAASVAAAEPVLVLDTSHLPAHVGRALEERAREGVPEVIRYLNRTRFMHQLRVEDVFRPQALPLRTDAAPQEQAQPTLAAGQAGAR